jgi:hypothetical protein
VPYFSAKENNIERRMLLILRGPKKGLPDACGGPNHLDG